jgi:hypothetical protein
MLEYLVYADVIGEKDQQALASLFATKMIKGGKAADIIEFLFMLCRGSGDMDTSLGNGVLNYIATMYFMILNFCTADCKFDNCDCDFNKFVLKGDDSYGRMKPQSTLKNTYADFGFDAKLIVREDPLTTEFCSGHFVRLNNGRYYYVQKLEKLMTSLQVVINPDVIRNGWVAHYYRSLGDMYSVLYKGIPVYEDIAEFCKTASDKFRININLVDESYGASEAFKNTKRNAEKVDVCAETLVDISLNNQLSFAELDAISKFCKNSRIVLPPSMTRRCNLKGRTNAISDEVDDAILDHIDYDSCSKHAKIWRRELTKLFHADDKQRCRLLQQSIHSDYCWNKELCCH